MLQQIKKTAKYGLITGLAGFGMLLPVLAVGPSIAYAGGPSTLTELKQDQRKTKDCSAGAASLNTSNCGIIEVIVVATNILTAVAAVAIVGMVIVGGVQYSAAGANPQAVSAAKGKIRNALTALFVLVFTYSFLQWLIPGGVFK